MRAALAAMATMTGQITGRAAKVMALSRAASITVMLMHPAAAARPAAR